MEWVTELTLCYAFSIVKFFFLKKMSGDFSCVYPAVLIKILAWEGTAGYTESREETVI
jgi:hypothetical protein